MNRDANLSPEMQNAFIDGELDAADWTQMIDRLGRDAELRRELCELRAMKDMVRSAYAGVQAQDRPQQSRPGPRALAAGLAVALLGAGWIAHSWTVPAPQVAGDPALRPAVSASHVLVHVSSGQAETLSTALDEIEDLLRASKAAGRALDLEVVANSSGLDLLRADASPHAARISALRLRYPNLAFIACNQTIDRLRERGVTVELLPGVQVAPSALDQVVKRMQSGWAYIRA